MRNGSGLQPFFTFYALRFSRLIFRLILMKRLTTLLLALAILLAGCGTPKEKTQMKVLFAGSLIIPFAELERAYEADHPDVDVLMEGHGSIQAVRHVTEIHNEADVVVVADHALIPMLMYAGKIEETGEPYANWKVKFAGNRLALAYTPQSRHANELTADTWFDVLARSDVRIGLSDPRLDASGYRTLMAWQLAETVYNRNTIFDNLTMGRFKQPITVQSDGDRSIILVPELLEPKPDSGIVMRGSSIQLISLLEAGEIDYAFEYESVIKQHGLEMLALPPEINLGEAAQAETYNRVEVRLDFQRFASVNPVFSGEVIGYGVTIPANAPHPAQAADLVSFMLGPEGRKIMEANHHPFPAAFEVDGAENLPPTLHLDR